MSGGRDSNEGSTGAATTAPHVALVFGKRIFGDSLRLVLERAGLIVTVATSTEELSHLASRGSVKLVLTDASYLPDRPSSPGRSVWDEIETIVAVGDRGSHPWEGTRPVGRFALVHPDTPLVELKDVVWTAVAQGRFPSRAARTMRRRRDEARSHPAPDTLPLTARELEILSYLVAGASGETIARELAIGTNTVRSHVQRILMKLNAKSRLEAAAIAVRRGLVPATGGSGRNGSR